MDHGKMAEGRRKAAERRQQQADEKAAEAKRLQEELEQLSLDPEAIQQFRRLRVQIKTFLDEIRVLSKKTPDGPVNLFKIKLLNDVLKKVTAILGPEDQPFPDFEAFDEAQLPTTSDVVVMLSHYIDSMKRFVTRHTYEDDDEEGVRRRWWHTKEEEDIEAK